MQKTSIEWTDYTSNPIRAAALYQTGWHCVKVSPGCANCYAELINKWRGTGMSYVAKNDTQVRFVLNQEELAAIARSRKRGRVFMCDMCDMFHEGIPDAFLDAIWGTMAVTPHLTFQVLTKRPIRAREYLLKHGASTPNVWIGTSVEDQERADERIPILLETPAAARFVSYEPAIGAVDLSLYIAGLDWVICGGESGPGARPCDIAWLRSVVRECHARQVPVFVKQLGAKPVTWLDWSEPVASWTRFRPVAPVRGVPWRLSLTDRKGGDMAEWPADLRVREYPHDRSGHTEPPERSNGEHGNDCRVHLA